MGTRATYYDGELAGIALALEDQKDNLMLAILFDSKPALRAMKKLDRGQAAPGRQSKPGYRRLCKLGQAPGRIRMPPETSRATRLQTGSAKKQPYLAMSLKV